jgi:hypothetical protein
MWVAVLFGLVTMLGFAGLSFAIDAPVWQELLVRAMALLAVVGVIELALTRLEVRPDGLAFRSGFRRRFLARRDIESVTWAKGAGVSVKLVGGQWVNLPSVGRTSKGLANSVRAWLKRNPVEGLAAQPRSDSYGHVEPRNH